MQASDLQTALTENSFDRYYAEYSGFLFNHLAHGAIAINRLGGEKRHLDQFVQNYVKHLEPKGGPTHRNHPELPGVPVSELKGKYRGFYTILQHYKDLLEGQYGGSIDDVIRGEFPGLIQGMAGAALHGLIHLGYGFSASTPHLVCEGLAFLHYCHTPLITTGPAPDIHTLGQGSMGVLEVVDKVRQDTELQDFMLSELEADWIKEKNYGDFDGKFAILLTLGANQLLEYVHQIEIPLDLTTMTEEKLQQCLLWLIQSAIKLYQSSHRRNDFFLLHGVTSSFALSQLLPALKDLDTAISTVRLHIALLLTVYLVVGSPAIRKQQLTEPDVSGLSLDDMAARVLGMGTKADAHVIKLVQVCRDINKSSRDKTMDEICIRACLTAMENPLNF